MTIAASMVVVGARSAGRPVVRVAVWLIERVDATPFLRQSTPMDVVGGLAEGRDQAFSGPRCGAARRHQLAICVLIERDYRPFRRKHASIVGSGRSQRAASRSSRASPTRRFRLQREGMIAKAFQFKGLEPVALVLPEARDARRYLEVFGIRRFLQLADFIDADSTARPSEGKELLARFRAQRPDGPTFRGADVGREALSTVSRYLHEAESISTPEPRKLC